MALDIFIGAALCVVTIGMGYAGLHVTLHPADTPRQKRLYKMAFFLLALTSVGLVVWQGIRNGGVQQRAVESNTRLSSSLDNLGTATKETARIQSLNTQLQERLLSQGKTIEDLARDQVKTLIGAGSFCYVDFERDSLDRGTPVLFVDHQGKYPLYNVEARIVDIESTKAYFSQRKSKGVPISEAGPAMGIVVHVGDMAVGSSTVLGVSTDLTSAEERNFNVFFTARNGFWLQQIKIRQIGSRRFVATRVLNAHDPSKAKRTLYFSVAKEFPRNSKGEIEWAK